MLSEKYMRLLSLFAPRYWGAWIGAGILRVLSLLPKNMLWATARGLGLFAMKVVPSRVKIAARNIELCFPELSAEEQAHIVKESFAMLGVGLLVGTVAWWGSERKLNRWLGEIQGREYLEQARAQKKSIIILSGHFIGLEIGARLTSSQCNISPSFFYRPLSNKVFEHISREGRNRYMKPVSTNESLNMLKIIRALKKTDAFIYLPDQNFKREYSVFVPFMGVETLTLTTTSHIAKITDSVVIPIFAYYKSATKTVDIEILPPLDNFPSDDNKLDATRTNQIFEYAIRKHPEQYMWLHRRFKIRPEGEPPIY
jgi:KDO2-lipid IV(A) lauroyltransferase